MDVSDTARVPFVTGIQRVVRQLVAALANEAASRKIEIIPVIITTDGAIPVPAFTSDAQSPWAPMPLPIVNRLSTYLLARRTHWLYGRIWAVGRKIWRVGQAGLRPFRRLVADRKVSFRTGDILLMPEGSWSSNPWSVIEDVRASGGQVFVIWYDMIPILRPEFFEVELSTAFELYLDKVLTQVDGLIAISNTVKVELNTYAAGKFDRYAKLHHALPAVHLTTRPAVGDAALEMIFHEHALFLLSTLEPRKGHALLIDAAELLWAKGYRFNLLFAGRVGWKVRDLMHRLEAHPQRDKQLFVRHDLSDAQVAYGLSHASCLVLPSQAEGLGLPILEAEHFGCPVLCTDLPVFREVAGADTQFFSPYTAEALADALLPIINGGPRVRTTSRPGPAAIRTPAEYACDILAIVTREHGTADAQPASSPPGGDKR